MQKDELSYTSAYQRALKEGYDEGFEKGREEGHEKVREILRQELQRQREALFDVMLKRFPHLARPTRDYAETIDDPGKLLRLFGRMVMIPTVEGAEVLLQIMVDESKETN